MMQLSRTTRAMVCCLVILLSSTGLIAAQDADEDIELTPEQKRKLIKLLNDQPESKPNDLRLYWKEGIRMDSRDGTFKLKFGGRLQNDWGWISGGELQDDLGIDLEDGIEFRRARLYVSGDIYENLGFKLQFDFADGDADLKDAYLKIKKLPVLGNLTIGHFKEPFSLEELTSSKYITFLERALPNVMAPSRNVGVMASNTACDKRMTWAVGMFRDTDDYGSMNTDQGYNLTTRLTWAPWYDEESKGRGLLHVGGSYRLGHPEDRFRFRQRPEAHFTERLTNTDYIVADWVNRFGGEAALVLGPFSLQGEYIATVIKDHNLNSDDITLDGWYVQASYFLTGEHRPYKQSSGTFGRVKPKKNWRDDGGWGAWEVAARYSSLDFSDSLLPDSARDLDNVSVGLNWYLNPNVRLIWNYIHSMVDGRDTDGDADIAMMRIQVDF